jgi:hypothetical protein
MACLFICDGCGKKSKGYWNGRNYYEPTNWFSRSDEDGRQDACSRECIEKISEKTGKTKLVAPI